MRKKITTARRVKKPGVKRSKPVAKRTSPKKGRSRSSAANVVTSMFDARKLVHVPTPIPTGPYTTVHSRSVTSIATNAFGQKTVMLISSFADSTGINGGNNILPVHAVYGVGVNVPGVTESYVYDPILAGATAGTYQLACHAITATVTCADSALNASGLVYLGALPLRLTRGNFATWNAIADNLTPRAEMKSITALTTLNNSEQAVRHASPMDTVSWSEFNPSAANTTGSNITMRDALSNICIFFTPTVATVNYQVTIHVEWRVMYNTDQQLAATQKLHSPTPVSVVTAARNALSSTAGMTPGTSARDAFLGATWAPGAFSANNPRVLYG